MVEGSQMVKLTSNILNEKDSFLPAPLIHHFQDYELAPLKLQNLFITTQCA